VFVDGFAKNEKDNIQDDELRDLRKLSAMFLNYDVSAVQALLAIGEWIQVKQDGTKIP
jgi:hypothetical protein